MQLKNTVLQNNNNDEIFNDGDVKSIPQPTGKVPTKLHQYSVQQQQRTTNGKVILLMLLMLLLLLIMKLMSKQHLNIIYTRHI